jgi:hypothetical protein
LPNDNYYKFSITSERKPVAVPDYYYTEHQTAILRGELFHCFGEITIGQGVTKVCQLKTGNIDTYAFGLRLESNIASLIYTMTEAPTITDGVTALTGVNFNRDSSKLPLYRLYVDPTNVSGGTLIKEYRHYSLPNAPVLTTMAGNGTFFKLKRNTSYALSFTNGDNAERKVFSQLIIMEGAGL